MPIIQENHIEIKEWIIQGKKGEFTHLLSISDTVHNKNYPIYVAVDEDLEEMEAKFNNVNGQLINWTLDLSKYSEEGTKVYNKQFT